MTVFAPPGRTCEVKLLRIVNTTAADRMFTVASIAEIVLDETAVESQGAIEVESDPDCHALYFRNPKNIFVKGWAFATTSLAAEFAETAPRRTFGAINRQSPLPYIVEHGHPDITPDKPQRSVAAFSGAVEVKAGSETTLTFVLGQTGTLDDARHFAEVARRAGMGAARPGGNACFLGRCARRRSASRPTSRSSIG